MFSNLDSLAEKYPDAQAELKEYQQGVLDGTKSPQEIIRTSSAIISTVAHMAEQIGYAGLLASLTITDPEEKLKVFVKTLKDLFEGTLRAETAVELLVTKQLLPENEILQNLYEGADEDTTELLDTIQADLDDFNAEQASK